MSEESGRAGQSTELKQVIDFNEARAQKLAEKRRKTERIFFKHLLNVYSVVGKSTMYPIELIEVSEEGCSFQVPFEPKHPWPTDLADIPLRLYFSQDTYLEIMVKIQNSKPFIDRNGRSIRFGCLVDKTVASYAAYRQFVFFLKSYAEHARKDLGDVTVFYI
ncbi:MAG: hypothetical protein AABZ06_07375 [Bdellovibrionota bacterium]